MALPMSPGGRWRRLLLWAIGFAYALTAFLGTPAVLSEQTAWAVSEYKRVKESGSRRVRDPHPYIKSHMAIPVAPLLIVNYHEYVIDGLYGFGGFELTLWYVFGVRSLIAVPLWVS